MSWFFCKASNRKRRQEVQKVLAGAELWKACMRWWQRAGQEEEMNLASQRVYWREVYICREGSSASVAGQW